MNDVSRPAVVATLNGGHRPLAAATGFPAHGPVGPRPGSTVTIVPAALASRLRGPGGYYNIGNVLGLVMGIAVQVASMPDASAGNGLWAFFAGSPSACAMTAATGIFLVSGECYHRAWNGGRPDERLNRIADLLSGVGALALAVALFMLGYPVLAVTSGLMGAAGKLGSALYPRLPSTTWPPSWPDPFRSGVVASRIPAMLASAGEFWTTVAIAISGGPILPALTPATLLVCYLLWARADLLLLEGDRPPTERQTSDANDPSSKR